VTVVALVPLWSLCVRLDVKPSVGFGCYIHLVLLDLLQCAVGHFALSNYVSCLWWSDSDMAHELVTSSLRREPNAGSEMKPPA
jgi:hypothetical protein